MTLANALPDYSYVYASDGDPNGVFVARCVTGLGPNDTYSGVNGELGGFYFNGNMIPNSPESGSCGSAVIRIVPGSLTAGTNNAYQCEPMTTNAEGVYTCTMLNSSMMNESVRFGVYFSGRSELLD